MDLIKDKKNNITTNDLIKVLEKYKNNDFMINVWIFGEERNKYLINNPYIFGNLGDDNIFDFTIIFYDADLEIDEKKTTTELKPIRLEESEQTKEQKIAFQRAKHLIELYEAKKIKINIKKIINQEL